MVEGTEGNVTLHVKKTGTSRVFRRHAMRVSGQTYTTLIGEIDGNRVYVRQADGHVNVIFTDEDLYE